MTRARRTFANPVIGGFHPDPSICRVGDDYYLATSSFEYFPGIPIHHSRDLVHWRQIGNVVDRPTQLPFPDSLAPSHGIWAPTLRHHDGRFWLATHAVGAGGTCVFHAEQPSGPWSDPVFIDLPGIDPDLAWDGDDCWCATSGIRIARIDPSTGTVLEGPTPAWGGAGGAYPEGPHLFQRGAWWYLLVAEGGTEHGHGVTIARAPSPRGPWTAGPSNPILSHRSTDRPIQSTGHADLTETPDSEWWMVLLGTRPHGASPRFHGLGRETFLAPVSWEDGWPVVGPVEPTMAAPARWHPWPVLPPRDDFDDARGLDPAFVSPRARPATAWSLVDRPGWLTLRATGPSLDAAPYTWIGKRQAAPRWAVDVRVDAADDAVAGLSIRLDEAHHYDLEVGGGRVAAIARIGPLRTVLASRRVGTGPLEFGVRIAPSDGRGGPDAIAFHVAGQEAALASIDGRYVSTEVATGFTGRVIGMYVTRGSAHFDWYGAS